MWNALYLLIIYSMFILVNISDWILWYLLFQQDIGEVVPIKLLVGI